MGFFDKFSEEKTKQRNEEFKELSKKAQESIIEKYGRLLTEEECIKWTEEAKKEIYNNET